MKHTWILAALLTLPLLAADNLSCADERLENSVAQL